MSLSQRFYLNYRKAVTFNKLVKREISTLTPMPLVARLRMWFSGFFSAAWFRYEFYLGKNRPSDYVTDYEENIRASKVNPIKYTAIVDDKIIFPLFFGKFASVVENIAFINNGLVVPQSKANVIDSPEKLVDWLASGNDLVMKPADGSRGGKVHKLYFRESEGFVWNGKTVDRGLLINEIPKLHYNIVCPWVKQAAYAERIYARTTNTVRILTVIDPDSNRAFIAHAVQRIGTKHSFPVDNFAVGGITCDIDIDMGIIGRGSYIIPTESSKTWYTHHPETNEPMEGVPIPNWEKIKADILRVADSVSFLKIIGWDIVVLDDENPGYVLLEGNDSPCFKVHQLHGGFLRNEQMKRAMKAYKIIK